MEDEGRLSGGCGMTVWSVWRLSGECSETGTGCGENVWMVWGDCLEGVVRLFKGCVENMWMVWGCCLEGVGKLSGGYVEAVWRVWSSFAYWQLNWCHIF